MADTFDNAGWVEAHLKKQLTPFQRRVADIVGIISSNAYNAPVKWEKVEWEYGNRGVCVIYERCLCTFDFMNLTTLVFLCHDARIRVEIGPAPGINKGLRLAFWQRAANGTMAKRHPNLNEAIADHREWFSAKHPLMWVNHPERGFETAAAAMGATNVQPRDPIVAAGFKDEGELIALTAAVDLNTPEQLAAFEAWKHNDGSKAGLQRLIDPLHPLLFGSISDGSSSPGAKYTPNFETPDGVTECIQAGCHKPPAEGSCVCQEHLDALPAPLRGEGEPDEHDPFEAKERDARENQ